MASNNIARLGVVLGLDTAEFTASIDKAIQENKKLGQAIKRDTNAAAGEIIALKNATDDYGKTLTKVQLIEREISQGKFRSATDEMKNQLLAQAAAYDKVAAGAHSAAGGLTAWQKQGLAYQTTDFFTQIASGQNVMIAAIQQGGQLKDQMGGLGNMFRLLTPLIFSTTTALIATGGVIATFAYGLYQGKQELKELNRQLVLTGNYAGITANSLYGMADSLSQMKGFGVGSTKEVMLELVKSGQYTSQTLESVSTAILNFSRISGLSSKDAADQLIPMFNGTAKGAFELTQKFNFLTLSQYKQIEALERQGKIQQAIQLTADLYNKDLATQKTAVDDLASSWEKLGNFIEKAWKNIKTFADPKSKDVQIVSLVNEVAKLEANIAAKEAMNMPKITAGPIAEIRKAIAEKQARIDTLIEQSRIEADEFTRKQELAKERNKIKGFVGDGGTAGELARQKKIDDARSALKYAKLLADADEENKILIESDQRKAQLYDDYLYDIKTKDSKFQTQRKQVYDAELAKENVDRLVKIDDFNQKRINKAVDAAQAERFARQKVADEEAGKILERQGVYTNILDASIATANAEKEKLEAQIKTVGMSEKQVKLAEIEAKYQEQITKNLLEANGNEMALKAWNDKAEALKNAAQMNVELADSLKNLQAVNDIVWTNMTDAIDNFVNAGGKSFEDFIRNAIKQMMMFHAKQQMLGLFGIGKSLFAGAGIGSVGTAATMAVGGGYFADGGDPPVGKISVVGERGPELFVPKPPEQSFPITCLAAVIPGRPSITMAHTLPI